MNRDTIMKSMCFSHVFVGQLWRKYYVFNNIQFNVTCFFPYNLMLGISNLPSNLCRPALPSPDRPSPVVCPPPPSLTIPSPYITTFLPPFLSTSLPPSTSLQSLLSQMLGGQDWPFAGPSLRHCGGGASARCLAAYSYSVYECEESRHPLTRRRKRRIQVED